MTNRTIIVGAGQAGAQTAQSLRQCGYDGEIILIGDEDAAPYQRPPLSKAYLKGELDEQRLYLRPAAFYETNKISLKLSTRVTAINRMEKSIETDAGETLAYDSLVLATGAPPRRLPIAGVDRNGVYYLRTLRDSETLRAILSVAGRVAVVGAGYIGLEVAAVARAAGREVSVIEIADRVLARVACPEMSEFYQNLHVEHGVDLRLGEGVSAINGADGAVASVSLNSDEMLDCAAVLIGVGAAPNIALAEAAGLAVDNGIVVDDRLQTSDPSIWAVGDCTNYPSSVYGRRLRLESVPNAIEQGKVAAANIAGESKIYDAIPWFWSDQYDVKLQTVGLGDLADDRVLRGDPAAKSFSIWSFAGGKFCAVDAVNDPVAFAVGKKAFATHADIARDSVADASVDLRTLLS